MSNLTLAELIVAAVNTGKVPAELSSLDSVVSGDTIASGTPVAAITAPTGGTVTDVEARAAIVSIIAALAAFNITV